MFGNDWDEVLQEEIQKPYFQELRYALAAEYKQHTVYPPKELLFSALKLTPYSKTRVVILGQDPYHGAGQAHGLSFSVKPGVRIPPSLRNIYQELHGDTGTPVPNHGSLLHWAEEGVLMLNTVLTVREGQPNSHKGLGWETFTDAIMEKLNERTEPMVFILWGSHAQQKGAYIDRTRHMVIQSPHPSPFSAHRGFLGSRPFSQANQYLESHGLKGIDWSIPNL
ncbi:MULTISPECIES: uracil-DNA glycosylase [unclassified Paenibacillus]|uniref:uracil-DNA glycosylase n=1 Tax=unclassified Paenibacillus TaxID=185978 RepID=UPI002406152C|nr:MULTISPECIES: uracil-DNA glycosylase [unclassified Paenibacillus]MDF9840574.1 uracil-DNA glycosylase [Paenibacillus sp. PastF-2]MDF9847156.1 uracil-DNA glycosylase [Paenibacillus sp. PastM-2]MDF9853728.1 uracil-DNA glycosylase [Paenibacillus sp. PastF-1]MDH6478786.1 uracil-DNA glycosylase [Paenibacillus sp. PastH-2]MDH6506518.1 uracil-DNA glycosylase [Paenibacillus sp. PastM-3]